MLIAPPDKLEKTERKRLVFIDSRDIDNTYLQSVQQTPSTAGNPAYVDPFTYTIHIDSRDNNTKSIGVDPYNNVTKISLKAISFPKILNEQYVIMHIEEFDDSMDSTSSSCHRKSMILFFDNKNMTPGEYKTMFPKVETGSEFIPKSKIRSLSKLRVSFKKYNGDIIPSTDTNNENYHCFLLEVTEEYSQQVA